MATSVRCILCLNKIITETIEDVTGDRSKEEELLKLTPYDIRSSIIAKSDQEEAQLLGNELVKHVQACHEPELKKIVMLAAQWNGFNLMKFFETQSPDSKFEKEKETMRDSLLEEVMMFAPEDEDDVDAEFEDEDELEDVESNDDNEDSEESMEASVALLTK